MFVEYVPGTKHAGSKAERSETMDAFTDCGMLLNNEDVVIDIDHLPKESIKALIAELTEPPSINCRSKRFLSSLHHLLPYPRLIIWTESGKDRFVGSAPASSLL